MKRLSTALVVGAILFASALTVNSQQVAQANPNCPDLLFIGVVGSGQRKTDRFASPQMAGIDNYFSEVVGRYRGTYKVEGIVYPASGVKVLISDPLAYRESMDIGLSKLKSVFDGYDKRCKGGDRPTIIVGGYSQGAAVVNRFARTLNDRQLKGTSFILVADPLRTPDEGTYVATGSAKYSGGIVWATGRKGYMGVSGALTLPKPLAPRSVSVCNTWDIVCDFNYLNLPTISTGILVHTDSYTRDQMRHAAAIAYTRASV